MEKKAVSQIKEAKTKNIESLYKNIFAIKESLQDAISTAQETANVAGEFGGEISRVLTSQINDYLIPVLSKYIEDPATPGAVAPLITFLDSVPLAMTREEPTPEVISPSPVDTTVTQQVQAPPTLEGAAVQESINPASGSHYGTGDMESALDYFYSLLPHMNDTKAIKKTVIDYNVFEDELYEAVDWERAEQLSNAIQESVFRDRMVSAIGNSKGANLIIQWLEANPEIEYQDPAEFAMEMKNKVGVFIDSAEAQEILDAVHNSVDDRRFPEGTHVDTGEFLPYTIIYQGDEIADFPTQEEAEAWLLDLKREHSVKASDFKIIYKDSPANPYEMGGAMNEGRGKLGHMANPWNPDRMEDLSPEEQGAYRPTAEPEESVQPTSASDIHRDVNALVAQGSHPEEAWEQVHDQYKDVMNADEFWKTWDSWEPIRESKSKYLIMKKGDDEPMAGFNSKTARAKEYNKYFKDDPEFYLADGDSVKDTSRDYGYDLHESKKIKENIEEETFFTDEPDAIMDFMDYMEETYTEDVDYEMYVAMGDDYAHGMKVLNTEILSDSIVSDFLQSYKDDGSNGYYGNEVNYDYGLEESKIKEEEDSLLSDDNIKELSGEWGVSEEETKAALEQAKAESLTVE